MQLRYFEKHRKLISTLCRRHVQLLNDKAGCKHNLPLAFKELMGDFNECIRFYEMFLYRLVKGNLPLCLIN
jgi:hypothetical protein